MFDLQDKDIWIFGGAGYLGSVLTQSLDSLCRKVVCIDQAGKAESLVREKTLQQTSAHTFDISRINELSSFLDRTLAAEGVPVGVVNLTYVSSGGVPLEDLSPEVFQKHSMNRSFPIL